jgi:hypothetical protein
MEERQKTTHENRRVNSQAAEHSPAGFFGRHRAATTTLLAAAVEAGL